MFSIEHISNDHSSLNPFPPSYSNSSDHNHWPRQRHCQYSLLTLSSLWGRHNLLTNGKTWWRKVRDLKVINCLSYVCIYSKLHNMVLKNKTKAKILFYLLLFNSQYVLCMLESCILHLTHFTSWYNLIIQFGEVTKLAIQ